MAKIYGTPIMAGGAGGVSDTLPPMVTNLAAVAGNQQITVTYKNPVSDALAGVLVVYKTGNYPTKPTDGNKVDAGLSEKAILEGLENGTDYYIRVFPYNAKKQYQTLIDGATTTARPSEGPKQVTDLKVTGSGASPVLTWKNPTDDPTYHETVVIQKVDSPPTSLLDGSEIYRGSGETVTANGLEQLVNYYFGVFTVNTEGRTRGPVVSDVYSYDFPEPPTSYIEVTRLNNSETWVVPENGYFEFIGVAKSGDGGFSGGFAGGGSGGSGGIFDSIFQLYAGQEYEFIITNSKVEISIKGEKATSTSGGKGTAGSSTSGIGAGGNAGKATGGNIENVNGLRGNEGQVQGSAASVQTKYKTYITTSGKGGSNTAPPGKGTNAYLVILRGNTNIPSPSQTSALSLIPKNNSVEATWENSGDPVQTGTMLVYNASHTPKSPSDGVAVDIPLTQPVTLALNSDSKELQEDSKKQSYTITGVPNDKPVFVALFPYDANKKYGLPKADVEIPRVHSWYDTRQELKQEVQEAEQQVEAAEEQVEKAEAKAQEATEQAEQAQEAVTMTRDFLPDAVALTIPSIYPEWDANSVTYTGKDKATESDPADIVRYQDLLYRCIQSHTSQEGWNPKDAVSLWVRIADPAEEYPEWIQPAGAHDAYEKGAKVSHNGKKWTSNTANNTWEPGVFGWDKVIE